MEIYGCISVAASFPQTEGLDSRRGRMGGWALRLHRALLGGHFHLLEDNGLKTLAEFVFHDNYHQEAYLETVTQAARERKQNALEFILQLSLKFDVSNLLIRIRQ